MALEGSVISFAANALKFKKGFDMEKLRNWLPILNYDCSYRPEGWAPTK